MNPPKNGDRAFAKFSTFSLSRCNPPALENISSASESAFLAESMSPAAMASPGFLKLTGLPPMAISPPFLEVMP